jgi:hypothetical protein
LQSPQFQPALVHVPRVHFVDVVQGRILAPGFVRELRDHDLDERLLHPQVRQARERVVEPRVGDRRRRGFLPEGQVQRPQRALKLRAQDHLLRQ